MSIENREKYRNILNYYVGYLSLLIMYLTYKIYSLPLGMFLNEKSYIISYPTPIATELGSLFLFTFKDVIHSPYRTKN